MLSEQKAKLIGTEILIGNTSGIDGDIILYKVKDKYYEMTSGKKGNLAIIAGGTLVLVEDKQSHFYSDYGYICTNKKEFNGDELDYLWLVQTVYQKKINGTMLVPAGSRDSGIVTMDIDKVSGYCFMQVRNKGYYEHELPDRVEIGIAFNKDKEIFYKNDIYADIYTTDIWVHQQYDKVGNKRQIVKFQSRTVQETTSDVHTRRIEFRYLYGTKGKEGHLISNYTVWVVQRGPKVDIRLEDGTLLISAIGTYQNFWPSYARIALDIKNNGTTCSLKMINEYTSYNSYTNVLKKFRAGCALVHSKIYQKIVSDLRTAVEEAGIEQ